MSDIRLQYNDHVRFVLQDENSSSLILNQEPSGWTDDELEIVRHEKYHGVFTEFTGSLKFFGEAKDYINQSFLIGGLNTNLYLIKYKLVELDGEVKWKQDYIGIADFNTKKEEKNGLGINFNSNYLETIIKSHEGDEFELGRKDSIDSNAITTFRSREFFASGKSLISFGESEALNPGQWSEYFKFAGTVPTKIISQGYDRHSSVDTLELDANSSLSYPSNMFFVDDVANTEDVKIQIEWDLEFMVETKYSASQIEVYLDEYTFQGNKYDQTYSQLLITAPLDRVVYKVKGGITRDNVPHTVGYLIRFYVDGGLVFDRYARIYPIKHNIKIGVDSYVDGSKHSFIFIDEAMSRLMEIITGQRKKFYSKMFGRVDEIYDRGRSSLRPDYNYVTDGEYGLIGMTSGYWVRSFDESTERYKSPQLGLKDAIESLQAVFNVGIAIETVDFEQRLRIEDLKYFYQEGVIIRLDQEPYDIKREVDGSLYFSGTEFGYEKGGAYENEIGLDEPNTKTSTVTPIRKTKNKYNKLSKIRSDDYGFELTRRQPQFNFPDRDTEGDESNWLLDLKRSIGSTFNQKKWSDRLVELPTGILSPETYSSMLFTPLRMLFRHGWILRAGMEQAINMTKNIKYINANANKNLITWFIGEDSPKGEKEDIPVNTLERPRFLPEIITLTYPIDEKLMEQFFGSTRVKINGEYENVPNVYFPIEFINEEGEKETGYVLGIKRGSGEIRLQKANENLIF